MFSRGMGARFWSLCVIWLCKVNFWAGTSYCLWKRYLLNAMTEKYVKLRHRMAALNPIARLKLLEVYGTGRTVVLIAGLVWTVVQEMIYPGFREEPKNAEILRTFDKLKIDRTTITKDPGFLRFMAQRITNDSRFFIDFFCDKFGRL